MLTTVVVRSGLASVTHDETRVKSSCFQKATDGMVVSFWTLLFIAKYSHLPVYLHPLPLLRNLLLCSLTKFGRTRVPSLSDAQSILTPNPP